MHPHIMPQKPIHIQSSAVIARSNWSQYYIQHCDNKRQKRDQISVSQQTPHTSPSRASYGVSIVRILEKNDRVRTAPHCICFQNDKRDHISYINWYVHPGVPYKMIKRLISYLPIKYALSLCGQVWWHGIFWWQFKFFCRHLILKATSWIDSYVDLFCFITQECSCFLVINCSPKICMYVYFEVIKHSYSHLLWTFHVMNPSESSHRLSVAHSLNCMVKAVMVSSSNRWPISTKICYELKTAMLQNRVQILLWISLNKLPIDIFRTFRFKCNMAASPPREMGACFGCRNCITRASGVM